MRKGTVPILHLGFLKWREPPFGYRIYTDVIIEQNLPYPLDSTDR